MVMKLILAGEDEVRRATREQVVVNSIQGQGRTVRRFNLGKDDPDSLLSELGTQAMFAQPTVWAIGGLEKIRSPKQQATLIQALAESTDDVVVSIGKEPGAGLKKTIDLKIWKIESFTLPKLVFAFCDGLKIKPYSEIHRLFRQIVADGDEWWLQTQLARTMVALLQTKAGITPGGAPFQIPKWKKQSAAWTLAEMQRFIRGLFELELEIKSGKTRLTWSQQFDILLASLYD